MIDRLPGDTRSRTKPIRALLILLILLFDLFPATSLTRPAWAAGSDFKSTDFVAAAPFTYDHAVGGGAYDDRTIGDLNDVVEQLEGAEFTCGDIVTFLAAIEMEAVTADPVQTAEFDFRFLANSTGQSGAAIADILSVSINYGAVPAGDGPGGTDTGMRDDRGSTATLVSETLTGPLFAAGSVLRGTVRVTDLEPGEQVILRIDTRLLCKPYSNPTGNLQGQLDAGRVAGSGEAISTGQQTIPFLRIDDIFGTGEPLLRIKKTVTAANGTCGVGDVDSLQAVLGDSVKYCYSVWNPGTYDLLDVRLIDDNATPGVISDDFAVILSGLRDLDGEGDLADLGSAATATGTALITPNTVGTLVNTASATGNNGLAGGNYKVLSASDTATVNVLVRPVANDDNATTLEDTPITIFASANDTDGDGNLDASTASVVSGPSNGTLLNRGDGSFTFSPNQDFYGSDSFSYQVCDTDGLCDVATVTIGVNPINDPPVANGDSATTAENTAILIDAAASDTDVDGNLDPSSSVATRKPANGTLVNNGDGTFTYTPNPNFTGNDSFTYRICDTEGTCDTATVIISVSSTQLTWESETTFVAYEDLKNTGWSDWDYNDLVVRMDIAKGLTVDGNLAALQIDYEALARGAAYNHHFIHGLPLEGGGVAHLKVYDVSHHLIRQDSYVFGLNTNFSVFNRTRDALPPLAGFFDTNTRTSQPEQVYGYTATLTIYLNDPGANPAMVLPPIPWDPYIQVYNTGQQVHLVIPGHLDNMQAVNGIHDPTSPLLGYDLPLAQAFYPGWEWPIEFMGLWRGYPNYVDYIGSGGATNSDWYLPQNADSQWLWSPSIYQVGSLGANSVTEESTPTSRYFASPNVADLDGDGRAEIIIGNLLSNQVESYDAHGQMRPGWPQPVGGGVKASAAVADLDQDGDLEVIVGATDGKLYAWHHTGQAVSGWPVTIDGNYRVLATPAIADLDGNSTPDIVIPLSNGKLYAFEASGAAKSGWPVSLGGVEDKFDSQIINSSPRIADLDGMGGLEIIVGSTDKQLYVFNSNGTQRWTFATNDMILSSPLVADIDPSKAGQEIAFGSGDSYVYLLDQSGNLIWKNRTGWIVRSSPEAVDLDADGDLEILIGSDDDRLWAWHNDGTLVPGWPQATGADVFSSPAVGDIDGVDGSEVVIGSDDAKVYAWHTNGALLESWPREANLSVKGKPALANMDDDQALEIVVGDFSGTLYIWNFSGTQPGNDDPGNGIRTNRVFLPLVVR